MAPVRCHPDPWANPIPVSRGPHAYLIDSRTLPCHCAIVDVGGIHVRSVAHHHDGDFGERGTSPRVDSRNEDSRNGILLTCTALTGTYKKS